MALSSLGQTPEGGWLYADAAAAIPGALLGSRRLPEAAAALEFLADTSAGNAIPVSAACAAPDPIGTLWFIRAAHLYGAAGGDRALSQRLLQLSTQIVQDFIAGRGMGGVKMDDGGLLQAAPEQLPTGVLRLNALWYSALESTATGLAKAGDSAGDHFERLAARFRRAFAKAYWCPGHHCICPPYRRTPDSHGEIVDVEQLLMTVLPASPVPRTKQRQLLQYVRARCAAAGADHSAGLLVDHPTLGRVESLVHRAWLGAGILTAAENRSAVMADAAEVLAPLAPLLAQAGERGLAPYYHQGKPVDGLAGDPMTTAEVAGALALLKQ